MPQTNVVRDQSTKDQPSMEDILASIRRIIDDGNKKPEKSIPSVSDIEAVANDDVVVDYVEQKSPPRSVVSKAETSPSAFNDIGIPELDSFLESLDAKFSAQSAESTNVVSLETTEKPVSQQQAQREASKYESRFSDTDRSAFVQVGNALSASTKQVEAAPSKGADALLSHSARQSVGLSFEDLSAALMKEAGKNLPDLTTQMLKPMLSDWLDNNLPSMVERLVRAEIERIARGE